MSSTLLACELIGTSALMLRLTSRDQYLLLAEDCEKNSYFLSSELNLWAMHINKYSLVSKRKKQPVQGDWTPALLANLDPRNALEIALTLEFVFFCLLWKRKINLQTLGGHTALMENGTHQMHRISIAAFDHCLWFYFC